MRARLISGVILIIAILFVNMSFAVSVYAMARSSEERAARQAAPVITTERNTLTNEPMGNPLHKRAAALGIDITSLTDEEIKAIIDEARKNNSINPLHKRAIALGIDITGLTDEEIRQAIGEARLKKHQYPKPAGDIENHVSVWR